MLTQLIAVVTQTIQVLALTELIFRWERQRQ